jgi:hypothetical protein
MIYAGFRLDRLCRANDRGGAGLMHGMSLYLRRQLVVETFLFQYSIMVQTFTFRTRSKARIVQSNQTAQQVWIQNRKFGKEIGVQKNKIDKITKEQFLDLQEEPTSARSKVSLYTKNFAMNEGMVTKLFILEQYIKQLRAVKAKSDVEVKQVRTSGYTLSPSRKDTTSSKKPTECLRRKRSSSWPRSNS